MDTTGRRRISAETFVFTGTILVIAYLTLLPLVYLVLQSFRTPTTMTDPGVWTLLNFTRVFSDPDLGQIMRASLTFATGSAVAAFALGTLLAWINERTNTPFKSLFFGVSLVPLIIPSLLFAIAWIFLLSPRIGWLNKVLMAVFGLSAAPFNVYTLGGMIWVETLHLTPLAFLMMSAAFRSLDPTLEESSLMSGAGILHTIRRITLHLAWPSIFAVILISFVGALETFEMPAIIGLPVGIRVFTSKIYLALRRFPTDLGLASAYSVLLLVFTSVAVFLNSRITREQSRYSTVTGKGFRPRVIDIGPWRYLTAAIFLLYLVLVVLLPFAILVWAALQPFYSTPSLAAMQNLTLENFKYVYHFPKVGTAARNSFLLAVGAGTIIMFLTAIVSWITVRSRLRFRWLLDNITFLPIVFPGLVLGAAIMFLYLRIPIPIYSTIWILLLSYVTRFLPYGMRYASAAMIQIHPELEESAQMSGATWWQRFRTITVPLLMPGLASGWILIFIISVRELASSILLYSTGSEVISIAMWEMWDNGQNVQLSALGVLLIAVLFVVVVVTQKISTRFGVHE